MKITAGIIFTICFMILKAFDVLKISWVACFIPIFIEVGIFFIIMLLAIVIAIFNN